MNTEFSLRLSALRKEKKISQKTAADALGVSQALLSHYEKGIRECGLDFIKRACEFYNVSSDYLIGISNKTRASVSFLSSELISSDGDEVSEILVRALMKLCEKNGMASEEFLYSINRMSILNAYNTALKLSDAHEGERVWLRNALETESLLQTCLLHHRLKASGSDGTEINVLRDSNEPLSNLIGSCEAYIKTNLGTAKKTLRKNNGVSKVEVI